MLLHPDRTLPAFLDLFASNSSLVLTNVAGSRQPVNFAGTRVAGVT